MIHILNHKTQNPEEKKKNNNNLGEYEMDFMGPKLKGIFIPVEFNCEQTKLCLHLFSMSNKTCGKEFPTY